MNRAQLLNDAEEAMRLVLDGRQSTMWTAMPAIVQSVDLAKMTCVVQLALQGSVEDENGVVSSVDIHPLADVPIIFPSAGGFTITLPLAAGDEVLVIMASRCIDAWWQSGGFQNLPLEARMHDLSDAFAIPGPRSQPRVISGISATNAQIRNDAGTTYVEIAADGKISLVSPSEIDISAPMVSITGDLQVSGDVTASQVTGGGVALSSHVHTLVTPGVSNSGPPA